jgi:hypothetical protein
VRVAERRVSLTALGWLGAAATLLLVIASRIDPLVVGVATPFVVFFVLVALVSSPTHRADLQRRRSTVRTARRLTALVDECVVADGDSVVEHVASALVDALELRACWFEPGPVGHDLPEITDTGDVTARVQVRVGGAAALPPLVAVPVRDSTGPLGRFVLESNPEVGLSPERRIMAVAMARMVGLVRERRSAPRAESSLRTPPSA